MSESSTALPTNRELMNACLRFLDAVSGYGAELQREEYAATGWERLLTEKAVSEGKNTQDVKLDASLTWVAEARLSAILWRLAIAGREILSCVTSVKTDLGQRPTPEELEAIHKLVEDASYQGYLWEYPTFFGLTNGLDLDDDVMPLSDVVAALDKLVRPALEAVNTLALIANDPAISVMTLDKREKDWQTAQKQAEHHCASNPFPGVKALAKLFQCSPSTMHKAIDRSSPLRAKLVELQDQRKRTSPVSMTDARAASVKQSRETDPAAGAMDSTDTVFHRLLEQATAKERAALNAMTSEQRRKLVAAVEYDPDAPKARRRHQN